ncbi:VWA domain-containing protein [Nostoc punctiforme]|uniref:vWA found in TerF C terminus domain-containing protein n=1 Tax=Nostoc punctiforme (strain ATCC 29133 / PCC 73102) TaxID=63737 RepID=B2J1N6_NOSP7|nr:VWA domain-containing protein [Nostoc punctiforme]ACC80397.1 hypothetical protein Npun_R1732 [Nostoc punctiforme PCC 73102]
MQRFVSLHLLTLVNNCSDRNIKRADTGSKGKGILGWLSQAKTSDFTFLERLDEMSDRYVDNSDFFSIKHPESIADQ